MIKNEQFEFGQKIIISLKKNWNSVLFVMSSQWRPIHWLIERWAMKYIQINTQICTQSSNIKILK